MYTSSDHADKWCGLVVQNIDTINTYSVATNAKKFNDLYMWPKFVALQSMSYISCHGGK